jgi:hypothetical protein
MDDPWILVEKLGQGVFRLEAPWLFSPGRDERRRLLQARPGVESVWKAAPGKKMKYVG